MLLIAHRGSSGRAPENTIPAFDAALEDGADAIEFDVLVTADGVPVVCHDDDTRRLSGRAVRISASSLAEIGRLDVRGTASAWPEPARIPTLEAIVERYGGRTRLFAELKAVLDDGVGFRPSRMVAEAAWPVLAGVPDLVVSSFDPSGIALVAERSGGKVPIAQGVGAAMGSLPFLESARTAGCTQIHLEAELATEAAVTAIREAGLDVCVFVVNDAEGATRLAGYGAAGVFTDVPDDLGRGLRELGNKDR